MPVGGYGVGPQQTLTVQDADGNPLITGVIKIKFTNGSVTDDGGGVVSINTSAGDITGSGTANTIAKFTGAAAVGNSLLTDDGTTFAINANKFTVTEASGNTFFAGVLSGGSGPTTITDAIGKVLSAALNTVGAAQGGTGVANNAASTLAISGNFATTLTVSGVTTITLPTSGTLLTTTGSGAGLSGVTLSAVVPNTAPSAGQILVGNAGGTAYAPVSVSGDATLASTGALTLASTISAAGPIGSATVAPIITYDAKGRLTTVTNATITPAVGSVTGLGTSVAAALAVNVGSAGAFVVNGGALGTPSSGVGTNLTGTASGFTAGNVTGLSVTAAKTLSVLKTMSLNAADDTGVYTLPTGTKTLLATDGAGTALTGIPYTLTGTANQVVLSSGTGNITFSLPQSIATTSTPQFLRGGYGTAATATTALTLANSTASGTQYGIDLSVSGASSSNVGAYLSATNGNSGANNIVLQLAGPTAGAGNWAIRSDSTAQSTFAGAMVFSAAVSVSTNLTNSAGTPGSLCYNTATFEVTKNAALTCTVSSKAFKTAISMFKGGALALADRLRTVQFAYIDQPKRMRLGFIAEELAAEDRRLADGYDNEGNPMSIDQNGILGLLLACVQDLNAQNQALNARLETLHAR